MRFKRVIKMFEDGNVCVTGLRGRGKDMLFANVIARRGKEYISNINYHPKGENAVEAKFYPLELDKLDCGGNYYNNFVTGDVNYYEFPYPDGTDIYISDVGVYFPSQYCSDLNRKYPHVPTYMALSRQLSDNSVHLNVQNLNRCWDKLREISDIYITCRRCIYLWGLVFMQITTYERYESCVNRVPVFKGHLGIFSRREMRNLLEIEKMKYEVQHGEIKNRLLLFINKSDYDTRFFKEMLKNGKKKN